MKEMKKRLLIILLALMLPLYCVTQALAAGAAASAMQLTKTEGTVTVSSSSGKSISLISKMRLYNGYQVKTAERSYAWINLDGSKLVKLDAVSQAGIRKSGKKLEILLDSGNIFFNVSKPLEDDESLNIRTATMVVGIRGTCGAVEVTDESTVQVSILEGTVDVTVTDLMTEQVKTDRVSGGETAVCVVNDEAAEGGGCDILRESCTEEDIKGYVLMELAADQALAEDIFQASGIDLRGLTEDAAADRLRADQEEARQRLEEIEQAEPPAVEPMWQENTPASSDDFDGGGDGGPVNSPANDPGPVPSVPDPSPTESQPDPNPTESQPDPSPTESQPDPNPTESDPDSSPTASDPDSSPTASDPDT